MATMNKVPEQQLNARRPAAGLAVQGFRRGDRSLELSCNEEEGVMFSPYKTKSRQLVEEEDVRCSRRIIMSPKSGTRHCLQKVKMRSLAKASTAYVT